MDVVRDVLRHNLWPVSVVPAVGEQRAHNLDVNKDTGEFVWLEPLKLEVERTFITLIKSILNKPNKYDLMLQQPAVIYLLFRVAVNTPQRHRVTVVK